MYVIGIDLGASSGRVMLGKYDNNHLDLQEIHRFMNKPIYKDGTLYWDINNLFDEILNGLKRCVDLGYDQPQSIGIDTWGVDFGLIDKNGQLIELPVHYRDKRTIGIDSEVFKIINKSVLYKSTGIQAMEINTINQLYAIKTKQPELLENAESLLFIPDLIAYLLTGNMTTEYTIASTSSLINVYTMNWDDDIFSKLGLPKRIFNDVKFPGHIVGKLKPSLQRKTGLGNVKVMLVPSHDTASAVVGVPFENDKSCFISCGTWSLLGKSINTPIVNELSFKYNFTNEGGYNKTIRFLKNISGLWLVQQLKADLEKEGHELSFDEIDSLVKNYKANNTYLNPDYEGFLQPGNIHKKINDYLSQTNQENIYDIGHLFTVILESLALTFKSKLLELEEVTNEKLEYIHLVGGGSSDENLCQFTANATQKIVLAGPVEATSLGNVITQFIELRIISDQNVNDLIKSASPINYYYPRDLECWHHKYLDYLKIINIK